MLLGLLGIAVLAGIGFEGLTARLARRPRLLVSVTVGVLLIAEFAPFPFTARPYRFEIPAADRWLAQRPKPFAVAEVPVTRSPRLHSNYMLHSMAHWQKTVHGWSGVRPDVHERLYEQLRGFPSGESIRALTQLGVTYVVVHTSWFPPQERAVLENRLQTHGSSLKLEYIDPDSRVYSLYQPL